MAADHPERLEAAVAKFGAESIAIAADVRFQSSRSDQPQSIVEAESEAADAIEVMKLEETVSVPMLATQGWQQGHVLDVWTLIDRTRKIGIKDVLCTDIDRDGMLSGPNWHLYKQARERFPDVRWQLSGGVSSLDDVRQAKSLGLHGVIIGKAIYEGRINLDQALAC